MAEKYLDFFSNEKEFRAALERDRVLLFKVARSGLEDLTERFATELKQDRFTGYYHGNTRGNKLRIRKGHLRQSAGGSVKGQDFSRLKATLRVGGKFAHYARTQEYGARIPRSPKEGYLRIPIYPGIGGLPKSATPALTPTGRLRAKAIPRRVGNRWETGFGPTFVFESRKGNLIVATRPSRGSKGALGGMKLLFSLKKSVKVKKRLRGTEKVAEVAADELNKIEAEFTRILTRK